jgi:hypothetical protein
MDTRGTKDIQIVPPSEPEQWYAPEQAAAVLGISKTKLARMRVQRKGPRFRKLGTTEQSRVIYTASDIAEYQNRQRTIETEGYRETQKAS